MKYLKYFENIEISKDEIQNHLYEIEEIFQEYIDDYNIEKIINTQDLDNIPNGNGLYYNLEYSSISFKYKKYISILLYG